MYNLRKPPSIDKINGHTYIRMYVMNNKKNESA